MSQVVAQSQRLLAERGPSSIGFYTSGQLFLEEYYTLAAIGHGAIGTNHVDLCTATAAAALKDTFACDGQPGSYSDVDHADVIALFGHNVAETPVGAVDAHARPPGRAEPAPTGVRRPTADRRRTDRRGQRRRAPRARSAPSSSGRPPPRRAASGDCRSRSGLVPPLSRGRGAVKPRGGNAEAQVERDRPALAADSEACPERTAWPDQDLLPVSSFASSFRRNS